MFWMLTSIFLCLVSCNKQDDDSSLLGFSYHDNEVVVATVWGDEDGNITSKNYDDWVISRGRFIIDNFDVTTNQDPDKHLRIGTPQYMMDKNKGFVFSVGRKGSKEVAASFNKACPPEHNTFNHTADELYFWVKGELSLTLRHGNTYTFPNTVFAQGFSFLSNNWWFGNDTMTNFKTPIIVFDPYATEGIPIPIYLGDKCFGYISPREDPNLVFKFLRGTGAVGGSKNVIYLIGVYHR